jgi:hypothetical protein
MFRDPVWGADEVTAPSHCLAQWFDSLWLTVARSWLDSFLSFLFWFGWNWHNICLCCLTYFGGVSLCNESYIYFMFRDNSHNRAKALTLCVLNADTKFSSTVRFVCNLRHFGSSNGCVFAIWDVEMTWYTGCCGWIAKTLISCWIKFHFLLLLLQFCVTRIFFTK